MRNRFVAPIVSAALLLLGCGGQPQAEPPARLPRTPFAIPLEVAPSSLGSAPPTVAGPGSNAPTTTTTQPGCTPKRFDPVRFAPDDWNLSPEAVALIDEVAAQLVSWPHLTVRIDGHTDDRPTSIDNAELSRRRARTVADRLETLGVASGRITIEGRGASEPVRSGSDPVARASNRRVDIIAVC